MNRKTEMTPDEAFIIGTLPTDPEIRYSREGVAVTTIRVVESGGREVVVTLRGEIAENVALSLQSGHRVIVTGAPEVVEYRDDNGRTINMTEFLATDIGPSLAHNTVDVVPYIPRPSEVAVD